MQGGCYGYVRYSSPQANLVVLTERGELVLVEATSEKHVEKARFYTIEGNTWNHLAMVEESYS